MSKPVRYAAIVLVPNTFGDSTAARSVARKASGKSAGAVPPSSRSSASRSSRTISDDGTPLSAVSPSGVVMRSPLNPVSTIHRDTPAAGSMILDSSSGVNSLRRAQ